METISVFVVLGVLLVFLVIFCLFLLTISRTLKLIDYNNRTIHPDQVWLMLIPFYNFYWAFVLVRRVSESIHNEFVSRGAHVPAQPTYSIGLTFAIASLASNLFNWISILPWIDSVASFVTVVSWIAYWISIADYRKRIRQLPPREEESLIFSNIPVQH